MVKRWVCILLLLHSLLPIAITYCYYLLLLPLVITLCPLAAALGMQPIRSRRPRVCKHFGSSWLIVARLVFVLVVVVVVVLLLLLLLLLVVVVVGGGGGWWRRWWWLVVGGWRLVVGG